VDTYPILNNNCFQFFYQLHLILGLADKVRQTSKETINGLKDNKVRSVMLTGDNEGPAKLISAEVDISEYHCSLKPHEKYEWLTSKQVRFFVNLYSCVVQNKWR
jgi:Cation transport ATPase